MTERLSNIAFIQPNWPAPAHICAYASTRLGGVSAAPYDGLNLGAHVNDSTESVRRNRDEFQAKIAMPDTLRWLNQVHGTEVAHLPYELDDVLTADASMTQDVNQVCAVLTADCLPLLLCDKAGTQVAAVHAGWRGLCDGVIEATIHTFANPSEILVWLGPAIGPQHFEVGSEVREAFILQDPQAELAFQPSLDTDSKWLANLYVLAKQRLAAQGVNNVYGGDYCTYEDAQRFFSYRRDGVTGRMASVIWMATA